MAVTESAELYTKDLISKTRDEKYYNMKIIIARFW